MLTQHQKEILNKALYILNQNDRLLIKGSAGVGKTYLLDTLIDNLSQGLICCSAPTNKAVSVLKKKITHRKNVVFNTTYSILKLKRHIDTRNGSVSFKPDKKRDNSDLLKDIKYLMIDESSMLNSELLDYVEKAASTFNTKVIFIGDEKQLPPVGENVSPVFEENYPTVELTEIIRQGDGNPIITLSRDLSLLKSNENSITDNKGYLYTKDFERIIDSLASVNGTDALKYLSYTNLDVDSINKLVRNKIYGKPKKIELGETIVFNKPLGELYSTNEELKIEQVIIKEKEFIFNENYNKVSKAILKFYSINPDLITEPVFTNKYSWKLKGNDTTQLSVDKVMIIHEDSEELYNKIIKTILNNIKDKKNSWLEYYRFIEQFADIKYNHALSVHKSQGSTFKQTIINIGNIYYNKNIEERDKMLYTAITRASDLLILYNT